jgi:phage protein D
MVATQPATGTNGQVRHRPARPTILVDGQEQTGLAASLVRLVAADAMGSMARCELTVSNWNLQPGGIGFVYFDRRLLDFGKRLELRVGAGSSTISLFDGRITGLEAHFPQQQSAELTVLAEDRLQDLRMTRRTRSFADLSDADLVRQVASDHGLTANVDMDGPTHRHIAQVNQSDLALLGDRCRMLDADLWVQDRTINAVARSRRSAQPVTISQGQELYEFTVFADLAHQFTALSVSGWDVQGKEAIHHEATASALGSELGNDLSGASILDEAFGTRTQSIAHAGPWTSREAQVTAESLFRQGARRFVCGRGVAESQLGLAVGKAVKIEGVGPLFSGAYTVTEVTHQFDAARGLRTGFAVERPGLGRP